VAQTNDNRLQKVKAMADKPNSKADPNPPMVFEIRIKGHLDQQWTAWFEGLTITQTDNGETLLTGPVIDQTALYGLLRKVRDLGLPLISVKQCQSDRADNQQ